VTESTTHNNDLVWRYEGENDISLEGEEEDEEDDDDDDIIRTTNNNNVLWVRAELVDLWRLILQHQRDDETSSSGSCWKIQSHYLLYPNPYPKKRRLKSRWYAHPSFPLILQLGGDEIVLRSNWETYLQEFAQAVVIADAVWSSHDNNSTNFARPYVESARKGPVPRVVEPGRTDQGWSNFERKMDKVGEPTFELVLTRSVG